MGALSPRGPSGPSGRTAVGRVLRAEEDSQERGLSCFFQKSPEAFHRPAHAPLVSTAAI